MTLVLTVEVPSLAPAVYGRYRNRIAYVAADVEMNSSVRVVRRLARQDGTLRDDAVEVEVFVPEDRRNGVEAPRAAWVTPEYLRCRAIVSKNRKSLREFIESGERERAF
ncbi:hypothetical protein G3N59_10540 [Paraburkholderia sp. Ac-20340]|uniref:hypothetical protein n=1 Tax=Paraburkholderia sp. Ac-20340 TaxID=2703888 RepID=UPI0019818BA9|nr:hypothetical protein [Paraburkholderia sp. Ac-20340]MBN3853818.1 hypothetical protein [Paraburkholderia sp. Ac-20340]